MLVKKEEWLSKADSEFRPWLLFAKILTSLLFYPHFFSRMSRCGIASPFMLQLGILLIGCGRSGGEGLLPCDYVVWSVTDCATLPDFLHGFALSRDVLGSK